MMKSLDELTQHILGWRTRHCLGELETLFRDDFLSEYWPQLLANMRQTLEALDEERIPYLHRLWEITEQERRFTFTSPSVDRHAFEILTPFLDNDVMDWALKLPIPYLVAQRAYKRMICRTFPELAAVPHALTGFRVPRTFAGDMLVRGSRFLLKRIKRRLPGHRRIRDVSDRPLGIEDPRLREQLEAYLQSDAFPSDVFDRNKVAHTLKAFYDQGAEFAERCSMLLTLGETQRLFLDAKPVATPDDAQPLH